MSPFVRTRRPRRPGRPVGAAGRRSPAHPGGRLRRSPVVVVRSPLELPLADVDRDGDKGGATKRTQRRPLTTAPTRKMRAMTVSTTMMATAGPPFLRYVTPVARKPAIAFLPARRPRPNRARDAGLPTRERASLPVLAGETSASAERPCRVGVALGRRAKPTPRSANADLLGADEGQRPPGGTSLGGYTLFPRVRGSLVRGWRLVGGWSGRSAATWSAW